jgi:Saxitoxin biosynthesis operon protein SxtJ
VQTTASSRAFGFVLVAACVIIAVLSYWAHGRAYVYWSIAAAAILVVSFAMPRLLAPAKRLWLKLGKLLHVIVSPVILSVVYVVVFIPVGAIIRLFGKDLLGLQRDPTVTSYWVSRPAGGPTPESLKEQF